MKVAILGSAGHFGLAGPAGHEGPAQAAGKAGTAGEAQAPEAGERRPLEFSMAPVEPWEDMSPVGRLRSAAGAPRAYRDWRELLDKEKPRVAVVNPPFHRIGAVARECLERGIHVFAEKPLATGWADYRALRGLAASSPSGPRLMAMLTMRYDGAFRAARRFVAGGGIGAPVLVAAQKSYPLQGWDGGARPGFYRKRSTYGGSIPWVGIHAIDLLRWFAGSDFTEVHAAHTRLGNGEQDELESAAVLNFKLASGAVAAAHLDFLRPWGPGRAPPSPWGDDRLRIAGTGGVLEIREGAIRAYGPDGVIPIDPDPATPMFSGFLDWVEGGTPMALTTDDCLMAAEAALRARDAADRGRVQRF